MDIERGSSTSLRDFLHVIFKHKTQILLFFGVTVCTVAIGSFLVRPTYEATSQVLVKIGRENIFVPTLPGGGTSTPVISINQEEQINSEIEILKSRFLAEKVVESVGAAIVYEDLDSTDQGFFSMLVGGTEAGLSPLQRAVLRLQKDMTVQPVKKSNVINISLKHVSPHLAARLVNTLVSLYFEHHLRVHRSPQSYGFFQQQSQVLKSNMKQAEESLETFKKEHDLTSLLEERSLLLGRMTELRAALNQTLS